MRANISAACDLEVVQNPTTSYGHLLLQKCIINLHRSRLIGAVMLLTHLAALAIPFWIDVASWIKLLLIIIILTSLVDVFGRVVLRRAGYAVTAIELDSDNNMKLIDGRGRSYRVSRLRSAFVSPVVTLFTVSIEDKLLPQNLIVPFDAVDKEPFRQLRVSLKKI